MSRLPYRRQRTRLTLGVLAAVMGATVLLGTAPPAGAQQAESPFAAARAAIRSGQVGKTRALGFHHDRGPFVELPAEGAILIGFDIGIGRFFDTDVVYALRPVYQSQAGETYYKDYGLFRDQVEGKRLIHKTRVLRTERLRAQPGYAVGAMTLRTGLLIDGLAVTFMRVTGRALDPQDAYTSSWFGNRTGGSENFITGGGGLVVGVFGSHEPDHVKSLGLYFLPAARGAAQPTSPVPAQPMPQPAPPKHLVQPPVPQPEGLAVPPANAPPPPELDGAPLGDAPPDAPAPAADAARPAKPARKGRAGNVNWVLLGFLAAVPVPVVLLLAALRRRGAGTEYRHASDERPGRKSRRSGRGAPDVSGGGVAAPVLPDPQATAIRAGPPPVTAAEAKEHIRPSPPRT